MRARTSMAPVDSGRGRLAAAAAALASPDAVAATLRPAGDAPRDGASDVPRDDGSGAPTEAGGAAGPGSGPDPNPAGDMGAEAPARSAALPRAARWDAVGAATKSALGTATRSHDALFVQK